MAKPERQRPASSANEAEMAAAWLDWQRATVHLKCAGLSDDDARRAILPSSPLMTVSGLVSHLRWTEYGWFVVGFLGEPDHAPAADAAWRAKDVPLSQLLTDYERQCDRSRAIVAEHDLDEVERFAPSGLERVSLRWIVGHLIEETARHLGHLDILHELIDGTTGS